MLSFIPGIKLENKLKKLQEHTGFVYNSIADADKDELSYLNRFALISNVGASTRIENAVLTDNEIYWFDTVLSKNDKTTDFKTNKTFIIDTLSKDKERSIEEVAGCREVLITIYSQSSDLYPLSETIIKGLHKNLLTYYPPACSYAGDYKKVPNNVISYNHDTGERQTVLDPAPPGIMTETAMSDLVRWYNATIREYPWPLLVATEFVFRFLAIHPFQDGNGRLGRALFLLALIQSKDKYLSHLSRFIAFDRHIEQNRYVYYSTLNMCSRGKYQPDPTEYNVLPLSNFFLRLIKESFNDISFYKKRYENLKNLSESAQTIYSSFKNSPEKHLRVSDIEGYTEIPRRTVQYSLKTLSEKKLIQKLGQGAGSRYQLIF